MKIGEYEQMMSYLTRPDTRTKLAGGTNPETGQGFQKGNTGFRTKDGEVRNVKGSNQFTPKTAAQIQAIINKPEYKGYTPTRFEKENILTRTDTKNKDVIFQKKGITPADPEKQKTRDIKRSEAQTNLEGRKLKLKAPSGYQVHHIMPLAGGEELRTGDYAIVSKEMNARMSKYNKKINKLVNEAYSLDFSKTEDLKKLKNINNDLFDILETVKKDLPKEYKGLLGFNKLTPVLDTFDDKGRQVFYAEPQGIDYKKSIAGVRGDKVKDIKRSVLQGMVNKAKTVGKVVKPLGYAFGANALKTAISKAEEQGLDLNVIDKIIAFDSGDAEVALNNAKRRVDPKFAAEERAKDLAQMTDDFEEVGQTTFGKYNDQIKNIKLP